MATPLTSLSNKSSHRSFHNTGVDSIDYKKVWMSNNLPTVIVHIETGQLLKGDELFMKYNLVVFIMKIIPVWDNWNVKTIQFVRHCDCWWFISLLEVWIIIWFKWSEYSQLVNCNHHVIRSFIATVTNPCKNIAFPCLLTMGPIMDYEGYVFQVSVSFTPLKKVGDSQCDSCVQQTVSLKKII